MPRLTDYRGNSLDEELAEYETTGTVQTQLYERCFLGEHVSGMPDVTGLDSDTILTIWRLRGEMEPAHELLARWRRDVWLGGTWPELDGGMTEFDRALGYRRYRPGVPRPGLGGKIQKHAWHARTFTRGDRKHTIDRFLGKVTYRVDRNPDWVGWRLEETAFPGALGFGGLRARPADLVPMLLDVLQDAKRVDFNQFFSGANHG